MLDVFRAMLHVFRVMLYVFLVMLDVFRIMLYVFCVMLHVFLVMLDVFLVMLLLFLVMLDVFHATLHASTSAVCRIHKSLKSLCSDWCHTAREPNQISSVLPAFSCKWRDADSFRQTSYKVSK